MMGIVLGLEQENGSDRLRQSAQETRLRH
jgi:hypothetical protein